jgi:hypothetical protein
VICITTYHPMRFVIPWMRCPRAVAKGQQRGETTGREPSRALSADMARDAAQLTSSILHAPAFSKVILLQFDQSRKEYNLILWLTLTVTVGWR